jgi:hypothetical protein
MIRINGANENGSTDSWMIATIGLIILSIGIAALAVWLFVNYSDQKTNVDTKIEAAVATAKNNQATADDKKFTDYENALTQSFAGPADYGSLTFKYPRNWSVYINKDATDGGTYEAYLNPVTVPPVGDSQQFALRVVIEERDYDQAITNYDSLVKDGKLTASSFSTNGVNGTRLDGSFTNDIRGSAVIFKIRDKTLTIRTDANTFKADFDALIATIKFNQ